MRRYLVEPEEKPEYFEKSWWSKKLGGVKNLVDLEEKPENLLKICLQNSFITNSFISLYSALMLLYPLYKEAFAINFLFQLFRVCMQIILGQTE